MWLTLESQSSCFPCITVMIQTRMLNSLNYSFIYLSSCHERCSPSHARFYHALSNHVLSNTLQRRTSLVFYSQCWKSINQKNHLYKMARFPFDWVLFVCIVAKMARKLLVALLISLVAPNILGMPPKKVTSLGDLDKQDEEKARDKVIQLFP